MVRSVLWSGRALAPAVVLAPGAVAQATAANTLPHSSRHRSACRPVDGAERSNRPVAGRNSTSVSADHVAGARSTPAGSKTFVAARLGARDAAARSAPGQRRSDLMGTVTDLPRFVRTARTVSDRAEAFAAGQTETCPDDMPDGSVIARERMLAGPRGEPASRRLTVARVPFEFRGRGRCFREQIADADDLAVRTMAHVFTPLAVRADRSAIPRPELLQDAARDWRQEMPTVGLLDSNIQRSRRELHIREVRVGAGTLSHATRDKETSEPVVAILLVDLHVAPGICRLMVDTAVLLSLHALGRWYQRALDNSEVALLSDLARLAAAYGRILTIHAATGNPGFLCPATGGQWAGSITQRLSEATGRQERVLDVRTFLPEGAREYSVT